MREWLSGGAPPCQGGGRGFDPRLALLGKGLWLLCRTVAEGFSFCHFPVITDMSEFHADLYA